MQLYGKFEDKEYLQALVLSDPLRSIKTGAEIQLGKIVELMIRAARSSA